ncbi:tRNA pseudouridine(38-40) synthase TruA [Bacillus canaveralius]|uniref:tRNA pseudouridine synthase A n=1 Tax=Bacillus canaveralius TaxID=1403243 RepID=A0A2N5GPR2_9BACI|nr:tRNA pseudouridine(38-40) synthase TruA [Bacillus canaveralius]PLR84734.1 tRNA pseudouridine(38-40) synthase TruA [Bacillus canaveralius]PLS00438.1 tRNA pseudouridine(38-40) synthase TruA [Bacillus canaveralius]RSK52260.1 tRNA pseudouridine(38-40) synthase TruA [Bacillus canaveralius]
MQRYQCTLSYDGSQFSGYQVQPNARTVQKELETALAKLHKGNSVPVTASGRTDAGVHAKGQVIHFDSPLHIPVSKWELALNTLLPGDIAVNRIEKAAAGFHARFDTVGKEYRYFVHLSARRDPFKRNYAYQFSYPIDYVAMKEALKFFIGSHDFTSFCSAKTTIEDRVRTIKEIEFFEEGDLLVFRLVGNGFLYNMVRIIVGTLLEIGSGERSPYQIPEILEKRDRTLAGKTIPGHGLYLWKVFY